MDSALNTIIMATKVKITYDNEKGEKEEVTKTFFGKKHMDRWISEKGIKNKKIEYIY